MWTVRSVAKRIYLLSGEKVTDCITLRSVFKVATYCPVLVFQTWTRCPMSSFAPFCTTQLPSGETAENLRTSLNWELRRKYYGNHYGDYGGNYGNLCGGPDLPDRLAGRGLIQNPLGLTYYMFICIILLHN